MEEKLDYRLLEKKVYNCVDETTEMMQKLLDGHSYTFVESSDL